ncbi:nucleoside 2-deoxyribosyltransferase [Lactiplantibacillus plantarum subsp. plantarum]|nr:nucleoside 2-deoxyribosyltransferase [Lactiplantibacillus plantarum subsp. plantarum]
MAQIYIASPFFSPEQVTRVTQLEEALAKIQRSRIFIHHVYTRTLKPNSSPKLGRPKFSTVTWPKLRPRKSS